MCVCVSGGGGTIDTFGWYFVLHKNTHSQAYTHTKYMYAHTTTHTHTHTPTHRYTNTNTNTLQARVVDEPRSFHVARCDTGERKRRRNCVLFRPWAHGIHVNTATRKQKKNKTHTHTHINSEITNSTTQPKCSLPFLSCCIHRRLRRHGIQECWWGRGD